MHPLVAALYLALLTIIAITQFILFRRVASLDKGVAAVVDMSTRAASKTVTDTGAHRALRRSG